MMVYGYGFLVMGCGFRAMGLVSISRNRHRNSRWHLDFRVSSVPISERVRAVSRLHSLQAACIELCRKRYWLYRDVRFRCM